MKKVGNVLMRKTMLSLVIIILLGIGIVIPTTVSAMGNQVSLNQESLLSVGGGGAAGQVAFFTNSTDIGSDANLVWDNVNKRLGIGISTPSRLLHLKGNIALFEREANSAGFIIHRSGADVSGYNRWVFGADEPTGFVIKTYPYDGATAIEQLVITKDDPATPANESKVGIGTTAPGAKLEISA